MSPDFSPHAACDARIAELEAERDRWKEADRQDVMALNRTHMDLHAAERQNEVLRGRIKSAIHDLSHGVPPKFDNSQVKDPRAVGLATQVPRYSPLEEK